ncbi:hypothetical protein [Trinickia acidisoli]|uniref:hypothetical protein n=1 Tax=Trinickia acidisoli TaxID=2767482 RepID=UPI001A8CD67D|nr:hypothetical protein [Trinickia acidisoli]
MTAFTISHAADAATAKAPCGNAPPGSVLDDSVRGAIGSTDPVNACVDVLRSPKDGPRRLRIFVDGKQVLSNHSVALGPNDGGVNGDPFQPLQINHGSLVVQNSGGGGPLTWTETWHLTIRNGQWIVAGWDYDATDTHSAADDGGQFDTSVNALTGEIRDSYDPPDDDDTNTKPSTRRICKLPPDWRSPSISRVATIRNTSWRCDAQLGKPL